MWHWRDPPICAFKTVIPFVSLFMVYSWSAINPCICFTFNKNYRNGLNEIITARSVATNLRIKTGFTALRKHASSSGTERICLRVIEYEEEDEKQDEQKEGQGELRKEGEEDYHEITEVRTERRSDEEEVLKKEREEESQV